MMQTNRVLDYSGKSCPILTKVDVVVGGGRGGVEIIMILLQMLPSLPTFLDRSAPKSIDGKLWLGRLPSLPILKARVCQYCQQSLADKTSC